ncbi:MAG: hypothetical protein M1832_003152 [Thelocarpon impressellum]|nr:MAG: hypothetical protein M1832_003152 [Thelocarpon impressellum]
MAGPSFTELSFDIKAMILGYIIRPTDMKNLCLVCKELREIAVRQLYRKVEIDVGCEADMKLTAFLGRDNPGLQHIRTLILNPDAEQISSPMSSPPSPTPPPPPPPQAGPPIILMGGGGGPPPPPPPGPIEIQLTPRDRVPEVRLIRRWSPAHFTVRILLELLPENVLEKFRWTSYDDFSVDNFLLLCKKQRKLLCIEVGPMDRHLLGALDKQPEVLKGLEQLHALDLYPDTMDCLETCAKMMECTPALDELWIESGFPPHRDYSDSDDDDDDDEESPSYEDESNKPGLITTTLFRSRVPFLKCEPMALKYLALGKINLRWASQTYMRTIQFQNLEELEVRSCPGSDALFSELTKPAKAPTKLQTLNFVHADDSRHYALSALENFLRSISSLRKLYICFVGAQPLPKMDSICKQGENLRVLILHSSKFGLHSRPFTYSQDSIQKLCKECPRLQQLAIGCPPTGILDAQVSVSFDRHMRSMLELRELATLAITSLPERPPMYASLAADVYVHELQRLAQWVLETKLERAREDGAMSKLRVIAFGANVKGTREPSASDWIQQVVFMPGQQVDPFGETAPIAVRVRQPAAVKFVEPDSDILSCVIPPAPRTYD